MTDTQYAVGVIGFGIINGLAFDDVFMGLLAGVVFAFLFARA